MEKLKIPTEQNKWLYDGYLTPTKIKVGPIKRYDKGKAIKTFYIDPSETFKERYPKLMETPTEGGYINITTPETQTEVLDDDVNDTKHLMFRSYDGKVTPLMKHFRCLFCAKKDPSHFDKLDHAHDTIKFLRMENRSLKKQLDTALSGLIAWGKKYSSTKRAVAPEHITVEKGEDN